MSGEPNTPVRAKRQRLIEDGELAPLPAEAHTPDRPATQSLPTLALPETWLSPPPATVHSPTQEVPSTLGLPVDWSPLHLASLSSPPPATVHSPTQDVPSTLGLPVDLSPPRLARAPSPTQEVPSTLGFADCNGTFSPPTTPSMELEWVPRSPVADEGSSPPPPVLGHTSLRDWSLSAHNPSICEMCLRPPPPPAAVSTQETIEYQKMRALLIGTFFADRGYALKQVKTAFTRIEALPYSATLSSSLRAPRIEAPNFVFPYLVELDIKSILVSASRQARAQLPLNPLVSLWPQPLVSLPATSLQSMLIHASTAPAHRPQQGCSPCGEDPCLLDPHMQTSRTITSTETGDSFAITGNLCCTSSDVVYVVTCLKCVSKELGNAPPPSPVCLRTSKRSRPHVYQVPLQLCLPVLSTSTSSKLHTNWWIWNSISWMQCQRDLRTSQPFYQHSGRD